MDKKLLVVMLFLISITGKMYAQYFDEKPAVIGNHYQAEEMTDELFPQQEGYTLNFGNKNKLFIPRQIYTDINLLNNVHLMLDSVQDALQSMQDSFQDNFDSRKIYFNFTKAGLIVSVKKKSANDDWYIVQDNKTTRIKQLQDTIFITKHEGEKDNFRRIELMFCLNNISEFKNIIGTNIIENFIDTIKQKQPEKVSNQAYSKSFITGDYTSGANGSVTGKINVKPNAQRMFVLGISADIQNVKNYFVPSASVGIQYFTRYKKFNGESNSLGIYWNPYFFFSKDINNNTKTYRNDFLFLNMDVLDKEKNGHGVNLYLPLSVGYLVHRNGNFLDKHTFGVNFFGVKYGNATLKPFIYFHDFFKGVTPSIQLSIGIGK
ncbi:hypothetical protein A9P82_12910 [Arachidicoccus ginsenosidimutans]|uniref:hypothetical protein n=1 Tax=Arachidicoccus sp. BS20 TaxID=1850526 RepID=UPI0007F107FB|nr:hypothetical protein [Arachidicoccus sp. BS20]ANI90104.1 hypothetical protein A9P82_12910 [Arachidicoccus sp. BS20]